MKFKSFLAFLFTLIAILVVISGFVLAFSGLFFKRECEDYSLFLFSDRERVDAVVGEGELIKLRAINAGSFGDDYDVSLEGPDWVVVKPGSFSLRSDESKRIYLYASPDLGVEGKYDVVVTVSSECVKESQEIEMSVIQE